LSAWANASADGYRVDARFRGVQQPDRTPCSIVLLINLKGGHDHLRFARVSAMHCFAVVAQSFLRKAFRIAATLCALGPRVAVRVKTDAVDAEPFAALLELGGTVSRTHCGEIWKKLTRTGERAEDLFDFIAEEEERRCVGLLPSVTDCPIL